MIHPFHPIQLFCKRDENPCYNGLSISVFLDWFTRSWLGRVSLLLISFGPFFCWATPTAIAGTKGDGKPFLIQTSFKANHLSLSGLWGRITLHSWNKDKILVEIRGPHSKRLYPIIKQSSGSLEISQDTGSSHSQLVVGEGETLILDRDLQLEEGERATENGGENLLNWQFWLPEKSTISLINLKGDLDHKGTLRGKIDLITGLGDIRLGRVGDLHLVEKETGMVTVTELHGRLQVQLSGLGDIKIKGGVISHLQIDHRGMGDLIVGGTIQTAFITHIGMGDLHLRHLKTLNQYRGSEEAGEGWINGVQQ
jgi:hypothetical protein